jgi:ketosteroid isomerase-like protein
MAMTTPEEDPDADRLRSIAADWAEAIVSNDAARMREFVTDDWVIVSESGVSPGSDLLRLVDAGELTHSAMAVVGESRVRLLGDTAVFTARITNVAHYLGQRFDADEWTTDVYVRRGDRWLCALTHYTAVAAPS